MDGPIWPMTVEHKSSRKAGSALERAVRLMVLFPFFACQKVLSQMSAQCLVLAIVGYRESFLPSAHHNHSTGICVNKGWLEQQVPGQLLRQTMFFN